jgi:membrane associated rhomboid family serine protease
MAKIFSTYTSWIIIINIIAFLGFLGLGAVIGQDKAVALVALQPAAILAGKNIWTLLTSMFMHANFTHLFVNMFSLFFIGSFVEKLIGKKRYLTFYILSGIFAGIFFVLLAGIFGNTLIGGKVFGNPLIYGVGASGAIFGLLGILAILTPKNRVYLIGGPLIAIVLQIIIESTIPISGITNILNFLVTAYIIASIFFMLSPNPRLRRVALPIELEFWLLPIVAIVPLIIIGLFVELPIGNMAHLGGLIAGIIYGVYLIKKYPKKTRLIARVFSK